MYINVFRIKIVQKILKGKKRIKNKKRK